MLISSNNFLSTFSITDYYFGYLYIYIYYSYIFDYLHLSYMLESWINESIKVKTIFFSSTHINPMLKIIGRKYKA